MILNPSDKSKPVCNSFPKFQLARSDLPFVAQYKYLGHIITNSLTVDNNTQREIKSMFVCTNMSIRKFYRCTVKVKTILFQL